MFGTLNVRLIIAGSQEYPQQEMRRQLSALQSWITQATEIISGMAPGPDTWGFEFAKSLGYTPIEMPALWKVWKNRAGMVRNREMAYRGTALLAFWDGHSPGTKNMIEEANARNLIVVVLAPGA